MRGYRNATLITLVLTVCCGLAGCGRRDGDKDSPPKDASVAPAQGRSSDSQPVAGEKSGPGAAGAAGLNPARPLLHSLSNDHKDLHFVTYDEEEFLAIARNIYSLGRVAETNDEAYHFLRKGTDPRFWKQFANWQGESEPELWSAVAGHCLGALALSVRPGMKEELRAFRTANLDGISENGKVGRDLSGALMEAARLHWYYETGGRARLESNFGGEPDWHEFARWKESPDGQDWWKWLEAERQRRSGSPSPAK